MTELATQTLHTVAREIGVSLNEGRVALEAHVEKPGTVDMLERCRLELHQVQGVLRVLEIYGAALLAEEMEQVTRYLIGLGSERKNQDEALDALMRAMVQLPGYLERVLAGGRDLALVLLPLLNDLRAVRGSALLSEGTLLLLNLKSDRQAQPSAPAPGEDPLSVSQWGRRLRARFQTGLIGWIRGERLEQNLEIMGTVATRLEQVATTQPVFQLWWVVGALIETLRETGNHGSISVKRLLGLADREMKRLYDQGEARYSQHPPVELLNNVLYYIARSDSTGPRVAAVRASFRLNELLPVDESIEQERDSLSAPSIKLMHTVAAAIREDLAKVKDVLDIYVRRGGGPVEELDPQVALLKKIGDTLGVLGLGELRARVQEATQRMQTLVSGNESGSEMELVQVAASLIKVEDHLDDELVGLIMPRNKAPAVDEDSGDSDFRQVQAAVLRECIINLSRIKEYVAQNVGGTLDPAGFDNWPELMRGIRAGLMMLDKSRAVEIIEDITGHLKRVMQPGGASLAPEHLDRLADAIVSLEYYIETLQAGRSDPWYMLDNARTCLDALAKEPERAPAPTPDAAQVSPASFAKTLRIESPVGTQGLPTGETTDIRQLGQSQEAAAQDGAAAAAAMGATLPDPDLIRLFMEEAREELAKIEHHYPAWDQNPLEGEALLIVRRSFHTLKGSGRMVNARNISEFSWAIESLLNRIIDGTLLRSPTVLETLRTAIDQLPKLVDELEPGSTGRTDVSALASRIHALASGRDPNAPAPQPSVSPPAVAAPVPPAATASAAEQFASTARDASAPSGPAFAAAIESGDMAAEAADAPAVVPTTVASAAHDGPGGDPIGSHEVPESLDIPLSSLEIGSAELDHLLDPVKVAQHLADDPSGPDPALRDIYARETASHVGTVRAWIERERQTGDLHILPEDVYRACHTLVGSSTMAEARHGIRLSEPMNHWLRKSFDSGVGLDDSDLVLLDDCMRAMEAVAGNLDEATGFFMSHDVLRQRIAEAEHRLELRVTEVTQFSRQTLTVVAPSTAAPEPADEPLDELLDQPVAAAAATSAPAEELAPDFDPEIAAIFCEEAVELLEECESAMSAWNESPQSREQAAALRRPLHTLKGGARMAGIMAMGELAHEVETLITRIEDGLTGSDENARAVAQQALDELSRMRESVVAGRGVAPVPTLIARIHALASGAPLPATPPQTPAVEELIVAGSGEPAANEAVVAASQVQVDTSPVDEGAAQPADSAHELLEEHAAEAFSLEERAVVEPVAEAPVVEPVVASEWPADSEEAIRAEAPQAEPTSFASAPLAVSEPVIAPAAPVAPVAAAEPFISAAPAAPAAAAPLPPGREPVVAAERVEMARVSAELLDQLLNNAGEVSIARARLEQQLGSIEFNLGELSRTVTRLKDQLRKLEIETEAQILHRHDNETAHRQDFDPLELDRYSSIQQFSRALAESSNDVGSIQGLLENMITEAQNLLQQQSRTVTELQNGLMRTRMVSMQRHVQRLARIVRQAATDSGKRAELVVDGASGELDRQVLERMLPPFEHLLRNAVVHGIETPTARQAAGKDEAGRIHLHLKREGAEVIVEVSDDGAGMNLGAIRAKGLELGLIRPDQQLSDEDVMQLVLEPGFSTASALTHQAGRGVGMDVVAVEIKKLGGALHMESERGRGTRFTIRLPFTLAISHALVVRTGDEYYALPLPTVEGVVRLPRGEVMEHLRSDSASFTHSGVRYRLQPLAVFVGMEASPLPENDVTIPVVLVRAGEHSAGLIADELVGSREIVVKPVGPQISGIRGISGATILGDGRIVVILDIGALVRAEWRGRVAPLVTREKTDRRTFALVVDDSITVRRVTQRLLERNGMRVVTARDGMDAIALLADNVPDIILLDIEMPRMDGYEVAAHVRKDERLHDVPIIMITSRVGEKHRARAIELGVDDYLGKPYQESQLLDAIAPLVEQRRARVRASGTAR
ncbi:MAG TPA: Hpt domain-containing protein [Steroidobacteraceae bacterium]|nr:Hpt domain-containing protein [Steroidobacteraceae bacterium]